MNGRELPAASPASFHLSRPQRAEAERLLQAFAGHDGVSILSVPAPPVPDPSVLPELTGGDGFVYQPPSGPVFAGAGSVLEIAAEGPGRFGAAASAVSAAAGRCRSEGCGAAAQPPRFFGGFAFAPGAAGKGGWSAFGDAAFTLPRWLYRRDGGSASLSLAVFGGELRRAEDRRSWLMRLAALSSVLAVPAEASAPGRLFLEPPADAAVEERIQRALDLIRAGKARKLVASLRLSAILERPDPFGVLRRLAAAAAGSAATLFLFRRGGASFLGATPELLIARDGARISSEALAGSWRHDRPFEEFLASRGIAEEHGLVASAVESALSACCESLTRYPRHLRHLRGLSHWATLFEGRASQPRHLFDLAQRLHPTPAVGAHPPEAASLLGEIGEPERGWYAAPIGYCDGEGNGELRVALRCALLHGSRAEIHAGAGIVAASRPAAERAEMLAKARPMLAALGKEEPAAVHEPFIAIRHTHGRNDKVRALLPGRAA